MIHFGQRLYEARIKRGLTIDEVAKATKIRPQFIKAIEKGDFKKLPSAAYTQGFVKNYITFLGLPTKELLALFRREYDEKEFVDILPESFTKGEEIPLRRIALQHALFVSIGILLVLLGYIVFQYRSAFLDPSVTIQSPKENATLHVQTVDVIGITQPNTTVTVNNESAFVDDNGHFRKQITLFGGKSTIVITVVNRFGRKKILERHVQIISN